MGIWKKFVKSMDLNSTQEPKYTTERKKVYIKQQKSWFKRHPVWTGIIIFIVFLYLLSFFEKEKDCGEETFYIDSSIGCFSACEIKCDDEGFDIDESEGFTSYFYYPDAGYPDSELRRCECWCEGCE